MAQYLVSFGVSQAPSALDAHEIPYFVENINVTMSDPPTLEEINALTKSFRSRYPTSSTKIGLITWNKYGSPA